MIDHFEIKAGNVARQPAASLLRAAWPPEAVAKLPWRDVVWAKPDQRLLAFNRDKEIICHVGIVLRDATWDGHGVKIGGIGGVTTREDSRRRGATSAAMRRATQEIQETYKADFGLLFCEPRNAPLYMRLGWRPFKGDVLVMQPRGHVRFDIIDPYVFGLKVAPRTGVLDLCGPPW
jgi:aminoglycoside 2'-N-acetyltransferase I